MDRVTLNASEGTILTNGEIYAKRIELGDWDSPDNYREITMDEYNAILQREENRETYDM